MNHPEPAERIGRILDRVMPRIPTPAPAPARFGMGWRVCETVLQCAAVAAWLVALGLAGRLAVAAFIK